MKNERLAKGRPVALVTGSRRGLGAAIAVALAAAEFDLVLNGTRQDEVAEEALAAVRARGAESIFVAADIADLASHQPMVEEALAHFGRVDCLVNSAAVQVISRSDMLEASPESFDRVMATNVRGAFFLTQVVVRSMLAAGTPPKRRSVIQVSSNNADIASPQFAEYCMSKSALSMLTRVLAVRLAETDIAVYEVRPGITRTDMAAAGASKYDPIIAAGDVIPMRRWGAPEEVGAAVASLATGAIPFSTGEVVHVDGGMHIHSFRTP